MYKLFALIALFALFSVAFAQDFSANIQLKVFEDSSKHWLAVDPVNDNDDTIRVDMLEANSDDWVKMSQNVEFGYWQLWSSSPAGFTLPVSFRLTSVDGEQVILDNVMVTVAPGVQLETAAQFARSARHESSGRHNGNGNHGGHNGNDGDNDSEESSEDSDGGRPSWCPTARPTQGPTSTPTTAPTTAPADPTDAPTRRPTTAPTTRPTQRPTQPATQAPTQRPTSRPTSAPTTRPTTRPTSAPTTRPTTRPTSAPTTAPTTRPTTRPSTGSSSGSSSTDLCAITPTSQEPVKILVPLYQEPGKDWDALITAANSGVQIIAIINPDNGPVNNGPPSNWVTYMNKMKAANIDMIGYVATGYAGNSVSSMKSQIDVYANKYTGLKGIFLDEVSNEKGDIAYYKQLYDYIMAKSGYVHDILNPGTSTDQGYMDVSTSIVIFESAAGSYRASSASWVKCAPSASEKAGYKYRFSGIAIGASASQMSTIVSQMAGSGIGMVYITDKTEPNPYDPLPSYWTSFANAVKNL